MIKIKSALAAAAAWLDSIWRRDGSVAMLAFFIGIALVFALGGRQ